MKTPIVHNPLCKASGENACKDVIHTKTNWEKDELNLLSDILGNYQTKI